VVHFQKQTPKTSKTTKENDILDFVQIVSQMAALGMKSPVEIRENLWRSLAPMLPSSHGKLVNMIINPTPRILRKSTQ
jgi:hypothetical protein